MEFNIFSSLAMFLDTFAWFLSGKNLLLYNETIRALSAIPDCRGIVRLRVWNKSSTIWMLVWDIFANMDLLYSQGPPFLTWFYLNSTMDK